MFRNVQPSEKCKCLLLILLVSTAVTACDHKSSTSIPTSTPENFESAYIHAVMRDDIEWFKSHWQDMSIPDRNRALQSAAFYGKQRIASLLLDHGADINALDTAHFTPLLTAASVNNAQMVRFLISRGAPTEEKRPGESSPLERAASDGSLDAVKALLENKADINYHRLGCNRAINEAAESGYADIVEVLIKAGANFTDPTSDNGMPTMEFAASGDWNNDRNSDHDHWDVVRILVNAGADINVAYSDNNDGMTVLHEAALRHNVDMVRWLVQHGAKVDARTTRGLTPLGMARRNNADDPKVAEIAKILQSKK